jgi:hypothetical protein
MHVVENSESFVKEARRHVVCFCVSVWVCEGAWLRATSLVWEEGQNITRYMKRRQGGKLRTLSGRRGQLDAFPVLSA